MFNIHFFKGLRRILLKLKLLNINSSKDVKHNIEENMSCGFNNCTGTFNDCKVIFNNSPQVPKKNKLTKSK